MNGTAARAAAVVLLLTGGAAGAAAQQTVEGPRFRAAVAEIEIGGRVHTQFNTTTADDQPTTEVLLRRVRLEAKVKINDLVSGKIQPDFAGDRVSLRDAYLQLNFAPGLQVLAGKAHKPFSLLEQTSSNRILPIERGARIRGVEALDEYALVSGLAYSDREIGLQLMGAPAGAPLGFAYAAGVFRGPLQGRIGTDDSYQVAARATIRPAEKLAVGLGWSNRDFATRTLPDVYRVERGNAVELDFEYGTFAPGLHILGEVAAGDADPLSGSNFLGAQAWLGYRTTPLGRISALEPILRVSYGDIDPAAGGEALAGGTLFTPGLNVYFGGLNRFMLNYDAWLPNGDGAETQGSLRAQFQLAF